ncbi:MAG: hypothetical protein GF353_20635 [Candidatus Lokiarchaeota archaeon]|nr:hypothetical protein [Candidatus Lokiarchaeota archaeon]
MPNAEKNTDNFLFCIECGETLPEELIKDLLDGKTVYCESCGAKIDTSDRGLQEILSKKNLNQSQQTTHKFVNLLKNVAKKKSAEYKKRIKKVWKEFKEKKEEDQKKT